ncbi:unnamed protein product [Amaranthus hypochondriacus]
MLNLIQYEGNVFRFPGGGTQFPQGVDAYINDLGSVIPLDNWMIKTAVDTSYGVFNSLVYKWYSLVHPSIGRTVMKHDIDQGGSPGRTKENRGKQNFLCWEKKS